MSAATSSGDAPKVFPNTRWSVVLAAIQPDSPDAAAALETICRAYWHPLYAYVRHCGQSPADAQDLTQEFFRRLLEKRWLDNADREKGRLRTFLIQALKHFMANEWRRASAQKRGGRDIPLPIDTAFEESHGAIDASVSPDQIYDRQWALILLANTLKKLEAEFVAADKGSDFETLKPCLLAEHATTDYGSLAQKLGVNAGAARVAVHRLRKRFRQLYREEISQTLSDSSELEAELRHLAAALACQRV
jgi:RNA polymerase sigma-70 factor (ECF subfamily)